VAIEKRLALVLVIKRWTSQNKAQLIAYFRDLTPYNKKLIFQASLLDDHVSPRIVAEVKRTLLWAAYLGQNQNKCFTDSESRPHSQKGGKFLTNILLDTKKQV